MKHAQLPTVEDQANYWDQWNASSRELKVFGCSARQGELVEKEVAALGRDDLRILDVGCGSGWTCEKLVRYGKVTGTDMTPLVLERARARVPEVNFVCGNFFEIDFPHNAFDVVVCLEVLSHVADQPAFLGRLASLMKPGGLLLLATQNRPVFERWDAIPPPNPAQIRRWVDHRELRQLLEPKFERINVRSLVPAGNRGMLRLANSVKLNLVLQHLFDASAVIRWKENLMLGQTLFVTAHCRAD